MISTNVDRALEWQLFTGEIGLLHRRCWRSLPADPTYDDFGPTTSSSSSSTSAALRACSMPSPTGSSMEDCKRHGWPPRSTPMSPRSVTLPRRHCGAADGRSWSARHVISTIPLGVLQRRADTLFSPPIPPPQRAAIGRVPMSNYTKIFAQWARPWWDVTVYKWAQGNRGFNGGELGSVRNLAHKSVLPGSNVLLFDLGEPQSSEWERLTDEAARARLVMRLRETHPGTAIDEPVAFHISRHSLDPLSYGAYSAWAIRQPRPRPRREPTARRLRQGVRMSLGQERRRCRPPATRRARRVSALGRGLLPKLQWVCTWRAARGSAGCSPGPHGARTTSPRHAPRRGEGLWLRAHDLPRAPPPGPHVTRRARPVARVRELFAPDADRRMSCRVGTARCTRRQYCTARPA